MSETELKPCPFCGERAETDFIPEHHSYQIECSDSFGCTARVIRDSELGVIDAWNTRAAIAAPAQDDDLTAAYMSGSHDAKKAARAAAQPVAMPLEPTSKQVVFMAGAILHQQHGTADSRHPDWSKAVEQAEAAYQAMIAAAPQPEEQAQDARQPLTCAEVQKIVIEVCDAIYPQDDVSYSEADTVFYGAFVRAIEAAHGIK